MIFKETKLIGVYVIEPLCMKDERGYFARIFCLDELNNAGLEFQIKQANISFNKKQGTTRGLHFQREPKREDKLVKCQSGSIYDVAVDLRPDSPTYGQWHAEELNDQNKKMFLIPKGFAHGFQTLTDNTEVQYFVSEFYAPKYENGIRWDDPKLQIKWPLAPTVISSKDKSWPLL